jgi:hypothetical protein
MSEYIDKIIQLKGDLDFFEHEAISIHEEFIIYCNLKMSSKKDLDLDEIIKIRFHKYILDNLAIITMCIDEILILIEYNESFTPPIRDKFPEYILSRYMQVKKDATENIKKYGYCNIKRDIMEVNNNLIMLKKIISLYNDI